LNIPIVDFVFSSIREAFGGRMNLLILGGSPFPPEDQHFLGLVSCCPFVIGYGLTESCVSACIQSGMNDQLRGSCGVVLGTVEAKLKSVPELGYDAKDWIGELYLRGPPIFKEYYKNPEETRKTFVDGWFKTGDILKLNKTGQFSVVGRNKDVVKLLQGEYVSIPKLTQIYQQVPYINQIYVHAGMFCRYPTAIVVLDKNYPGAENITPADVIQKFNQLAEQNKLQGFEKIKGVHLTFEQFTQENGMMTPSMKLAGHKIQLLYKEILESLDIHS
jgi:long-chain acyl-CoA synthetase